MRNVRTSTTWAGAGDIRVGAGIRGGDGAVQMMRREIDEDQVAIDRALRSP